MLQHCNALGRDAVFWFNCHSLMRMRIIPNKFVNFEEEIYLDHSSGIPQTDYFRNGKIDMKGLRQWLNEYLLTL